MISHLTQLIDKFNHARGVVSSWLVSLLVFNVVLVVTLRYGMNISITALQETITYIHAAIFMLGASYAFQQKAHVSIDFLYARMNDLTRNWIYVVCNILFLAPFCVVILWSGWDYVIYSWHFKEHSSETDGLAWLFILKSLIPLLAVNLLLAGVADTVRRIRSLMANQQ